jgi:tape measure domain-containing protein
MASKFTLESILTMTDRLTGPHKRATNAVTAHSRQMEKSFGRVNARASRMGNIFSTVVAGAGIIGGFELIRRSMTAIVSEAANFENSVANFTTMLDGSEMAARKLVEQLQILGAETPFEFKDLTSATQRLLGFGVATKDNVTEKLRMLGDLAQGSSERLQGIALVYGQIMAGGKMMGQDFNQLINQQVPIAEGLAKVWGVDVQTAIRRIKTQGPVMASDVEKAMIQMTSAGGKFYQGMMRSSKTLTGLWSTFKDALSMTAAGIGTELLPTMKEFVVSMTDMATGVLRFVKENKALIGGTFGAIAKALPYIIGLFVAWKVALIATAIAQGVLTGIGWAAYLLQMLPVMRASIAAQGLYNFLLKGTAAGQALLAAKTAIVTAAQWAWNASLFGCPAVWVILAIVAAIALVAAGVYLVWKYWDNITAAIGRAVDAVKGFFGVGGKSININQNTAAGGAAQGGPAGYASPKTGTSETTTTNRTSVDVNFKNTPKGTTIKQSGRTAPGTSLAVGAN